jgi:hypothetical protein
MPADFHALMTTESVPNLEFRVAGCKLNFLQRHKAEDAAAVQ